MRHATWTLENEIISKEDFCEALTSVEAIICCIDDTCELNENEFSIPGNKTGWMLLDQAETLLNCIPSLLQMIAHGVGIRDEDDPRIEILQQFVFGPEKGQDPLTYSEYSQLYDVLTKPLH